MALARILHRYDVAGDPSYALTINERLTLMPEDFHLTLTRRTPGAAATAPRTPVAEPAAAETCPYTGSTPG